MRRLIPFVLLAAACATAKLPSSEPSRPQPAGYDLTQLDRAVAPCDDFYAFAAGGWRKANPLPPSFGRYGRFEEVAERNRQTLRSILEGDQGKSGGFYASCVDEKTIEVQGIAPVAATISRIDAIADRRALVAEIHRLQQAPVASFGVEPRSGNPVYRFNVQNDYHRSEIIIAALTQGGLGLPDRDYYLRDDDRFRETRKQYVEHVAKMFALAGADPLKAQTDAERVIALETELARASMPRAEQRIPEKVYNIKEVAALDASQPLFQWRVFLGEIGLGGLETINLAQPEFFAQAHRLLDEWPLESWKAYLRWNVIDAAAPALPARFVAQDFSFRGRVLSGQQEMTPRWKQCVMLADASLGHLAGQEYVRRNFTPESKRKMNELIDNLVAALREDIPALKWMGPDTKREAEAKLDAFKRRIGYPDAWRDYSSLAITRDSFARNLEAARRYEFRRSVARVGKADDPNEWGVFTPSTVNASYNSARNFITFPAGILQPPFYDPNADEAFNYGGIGMVIGHEMTHGFDDRGSKFDAAGNLRNWWSEADLKNFQARAECIQNQYGEFNVEPGLNLQGLLVTGEAIADLGGATLAFRAYQKSLEGKERKIIDGFSPEQRFFLGFAQIWGQNMSHEEARKRAVTDPHAAAQFRIDGTVANMPEFARAFGCPTGSRMVREAAKRCDIW
ncbi:MAG: M13 family metallopeptidase [Thermoanaerobaculia bacterium]|nr:M13 family metallopeptidase [Thermoanaerobaculia bacterium]